MHSDRKIMDSQQTAFWEKYRKNTLFIFYRFRIEEAERIGRKMALKCLYFVLIGYLSGSVLYAKVFGQLFRKNVTEHAKDHNPGTANAFMRGGFWCGVCTLVCELLKGLVPVMLFRQYMAGSIYPQFWMALVLAAPVVGHIFPLFYHFRGGKGIAVSFGSLLGLFPDLTAALVLAFFFIVFSLILRISPHFYRTVTTYLCAGVFILFFKVEAQMKLGMLLISALVIARMHYSKEEREELKVEWLWTR